MTDQDLIYGKNPQQGIVGLEVLDNTTELFVQDEQGNIKSEFVPNKYWILTSNPLHKTIKLQGDLYYKYAYQYSSWEAWIKEKQRLRGEDIYCVKDEKESFMIKYGYTYFKGLEPKDISVLSFDIETTTLKHNEDAKILLISNTYKDKNKTIKKLFAYDDYADEGEMIREWCLFVQETNPSILLGHNILSFDLPYIKFIADKYNIQLRLGRDNSELKFDKYESKFRKDGTQDLHYHKIKCYGREICDTMFLAIRHDATARKYETYGLKGIIRQEGLEDKDRQFYDASQIRFKYKDPIEWKKIKKYCENDSDDALKLFYLMVPAFFYMTQSIPKAFQEVLQSASGSQINSILVRSYLQHGHSIPKATPANKFEGAISLGTPGKFKNVFKIDVASLYPNIMLQYEVYDSDKDPKAHFLKFLQYFTNERIKNKHLFKDTKNKYYDDLQSSQKIFINSGYGFMGSSGLNFNSPDCAEFVTRKGRDILKNTIVWATSVLYETNS